MKKRIGVFDSGVGGQAVVQAIQAALPELEIIYAEDRQNVPYGSKPTAVLHKLVLPILQHLVEQGCEVIVIACNTVSTTLIDVLRQELPVPLIAMEPMIKPAAAQTKSNIVAICATPATLASKRYAWLKATYASGVKVLEPDCSDWAFMIETQQLDHQKIQDRIRDVCRQGADVIVLGCTHYHWIESDIQKVAKEYGATVIQPEQPVIQQLKRVLAQLP